MGVSRTHAEKSMSRLHTVGVCAMFSIWSWHPPVGVYISILAVLGVLVPLFRDWGEIGKREKALWTAVMFLLVILEIKSIYQDRNEHDREQAEAQKEQLANFHTIANGINSSITASQSQFQVTMDRLQTAVKSSEEASTNTKPRALLTYLTISPTGQPRPASAVIFPNKPFDINVDGYLLHSPSPYRLWSRVGFNSGVKDPSQGNGLDCQRLLHEAEEELAAAF